MAIGYKYSALTTIAGFKVEGVYMQNWDELDETGHCPSEADYISMQRVCQSLSIPHSKVSFVKEYWNSVFRFIALCVIEYAVVTEV